MDKRSTEVCDARPTVTFQGRRQVKICGVDRHGERGTRAYKGGLEAERPTPLHLPL